MKIIIRIDLDDGLADPDHEMGVTDEGYMALSQALSPYGDDLQIERDDDA